MKGWTIELAGRTWTDDDVRAVHLGAVAEMIGDNWDAVTPWSGPRALIAWLAVLIGSETGDLPAALAGVHALPVRELTAALSEREAKPTGSISDVRITSASSGGGGGTSRPTGDGAGGPPPDEPQDAKVRPKRPKGGGGAQATVTSSLPPNQTWVAPVSIAV